MHAATRPLQTLGWDLQRPESVIARDDGCLFVSDARGGVVLIHADGEQESWIKDPDFSYAEAGPGPFRFVTGDAVNGLALIEGGRVLAANIGKARIEAFGPGGERQTVFADVEGRALRFVNHVCADAEDRLWVSVMADESGRPNSGFVAVSRGGGPLRIVTEGLSSPNECRVDHTDGHLVVAETGARRLSRFPILAGARLGPRQTFGPPDLGGFPDGICFDSEGSLWGVLIGRDVVFRIETNGSCERLFIGGDQAWFDDHDDALARGVLHLDDAAPYGLAQAPLFSSLAFHTPSRSLVVGSLCGVTLLCLPCDTRGAPNIAWRRDCFMAALEQGRTTR